MKTMNVHKERTTMHVKNVCELLLVMQNKHELHYLINRDRLHGLQITDYYINAFKIK